MAQRIDRVPKNYQGQDPTGRQIKDLLVPILGQLSQCVEDNPQELLKAWPHLVGDKIASMTHAASLTNGVLLVKVGNATLYSLLVQHEKQRLLQRIREVFPHLKVKTLLFRME